MRRVLAVGVVAFAAGCGGDDGSDDAPRGRIVPTGVTTKHEIAFIRFTDPGGDLFGDVLTMNADGSGKTNLTETPRASEAGPAWSPDGKLIAFSRQKGRSAAIWVMSADGSNPTRLTNNTRVDAAAPAWSPDGELIAFTRRRRQISDIWVMAPDGSEQTNLTRTPKVDEYAPDWSPDGKRIVVTRGSHIAVMNRDGSGRRSLTSDPVFERLYVSNPAFSPNGREIAFLGSPNSPEAPVWVMNADGSDPVRLSKKARGPFGPTFSPNGRRIAVGDGLGLFILRADGKRPVVRIPGGQPNDQDPAWSPASSGRR